MKIQYLAVSLLFFASCVGYVNKDKLGDAYYNLGNAYVELDRHNEAIKAFSQALYYKKTLSLARYNLARTYAIRKEYDKAKKEADMLLDSDPDSLLFRELKGWIMYLAGDYEDAIIQYEDVARIDPAREAAFFNLGILYYSMDDIKKAAENFKQLVEKKPDNHNYLFWLGKCYYEDEQFDEAVKVMSGINLNSLDTKNIRASLRYLGTALEIQMNYTEAAEIYRKGQLLENLDDSRDFYFLEGRLSWNVFEDKPRGMELFQKAVENGFNNKEDIKALIEGEDTEDADTLTEYFSGKGLYSKEVQKDTDSEENTEKTLILQNE